MKIIIMLLPMLLNVSAFAAKPNIQLATTFSYQPLEITEYWVSEKYDGIRGYWTGEKLLTRNGNLIHAPQWFTRNWPNTPLDGELWIKRNAFESTMSCILRKKITPLCWQNVSFMMFDLPHSKKNFSERVMLMRTLTESTNNTFLSMIPQQKVKTMNEMYNLLEKISEQHGEGLMLHHGQAMYRSGRSQFLLKVKKRHDAEATVLGYIAGKGKYQGMMGALKVKTADGIIFKIGSGFTREEREDPPKIDSKITYRHFGKTQKGVPKFASFWRIHTPN